MTEPRMVLRNELSNSLGALIPKNEVVKDQPIPSGLIDYYFLNWLSFMNVHDFRWLLFENLLP